MPPSFSNSGYGLSNFQPDGGLRLRVLGSPVAPVEPVTTKLNVFTTQTTFNTELLNPTRDDRHHECITCQLWNITKPGESFKCSDCSGNAFVAPSVIYRENKQLDIQITAPNTPSLSQPEHLSQNQIASRCLACEIGVLIGHDYSSTCSSCSPKTRPSSPGPSNHTGKIKRSGARRPPTKLESHALRCLKGWLHNNRKNPYPNADTKRSLAQLCGITEKQVNTWFTNARARGKLLSYAASDSASEDERFSISRRSSTAPVAGNNHSMSPAAQHDPSCSDVSQPASGSQTQETYAASTSRRGKKKDYGQFDIPSSTPYHALRISPKPASSTTSTKGNGSETWQCTFCYQHISHKSWRRHEETQHRPKRKWTCLLTGPSLQVTSRTASSTYCVFCKTLNPSEDHLLFAHRISECAKKSEDERTFLRPDHLRQHVNNFHKAPLEGAVRDIWRRGGAGNETAENWICGFCRHELKTWEARETHIAKHFKDGSTMADWKEHTQLDEGTDPSKKRPTSSEGRPNTSPKVARMHTDLPVRQQYQHELNSMIRDDLNSSLAVMNTHTMIAPSVPSATSNCFIPHVWGNDCADTSGMNLYDPGTTLDSGYYSAYSRVDTVNFGFETSGGDWLDEGTLDLSECWLW